MPTCALSSASVTLGADSVTSKLTITAPASAKLTPAIVWHLGPFYAALLPLAMVGMIPLVAARKQRHRHWASWGFLLLLVLFNITCGGNSTGSGSSTQPPPTSYVITVNGSANAGAIQHTTNVTVTVP
jgi:hypothetical protein